MRPKMASVLLALSMFGCAYAQVDRQPPFTPVSLDASAQIWVLTPEDGVYGTRRYQGSGKAVATALLSIVRARFPLAQSLAGVDERAALDQARSKRVRYVISPVILHWEDRATAWSGIRDMVRVEVRVLAIEPSVQVVGRTIFESRNNSITLLNRQPEDLLDDDFADAVWQLLGSAR